MRRTNHSSSNIRWQNDFSFCLTLAGKSDNEILDYKDLAAIPKVKAIYDIERPDLITYEPFYFFGLWWQTGEAEPGRGNKFPEAVTGTTSFSLPPV